MSRIVRKAPTISVHIAKGLSRASARLARTRQTPHGYIGTGRITFSGTTYEVSVEIQDTGTSVRGTASIIVVGGSLRGRESEATLKPVVNKELAVSAVWGSIPLPGTTAIAAINLDAERNKRDFEPGGSHAGKSGDAAKSRRARKADEPRSLRAYLMAGGNQSAQPAQARVSKRTVVISGGGTASGKKKTPCESQGWPTCCPKVEEGHVTVPE